LIDQTGVGDPIVEQLQRESGIENFEGYTFTSPKKQMLMEHLALAIHGQTVRYPDGPIVVELKEFEYELTRQGVRYSAPAGQYDDCVCALGLAALCYERNKSRYDSSLKWVG
jgi:hypothetical protein